MRWWPMRRHPEPVLDRSVETKTAAALATVDIALAELRAVLVDIDDDVVHRSGDSDRRRRVGDIDA